MVVNIDPSTLLNEDDQTTAYYILYSEIKLNNTTTVALKLANKIYSYIVITINIIIDVFLININLFMYNITLYYTSTKFIGIIIDTKAFKYFIVGYNQFFIL